MPIKSLNSTFGKSRKGVIAIATGSAGGQAILLLAAPLLSRIYTPADFGTFAVLSAVAATLSAVVAGRFELAIPLPKLDKDAYSLASLGALLSVAVGLSGGVALAIFAVLDGSADSHFSPIFALAPVSATAMALCAIYSQLALRQQRYAVISRRNLLQSAGMAITQVTIGVAGYRSAGLVIGFMAGYVANVVSFTIDVKHSLSDYRASVKISALRRVASEYKRFPLLLAPAGLLNALGVTLPVLLIARWYGAEAAGWLGLTQKVLALPVSLISMAVSQVYLAEIAKLAHSQEKDILRKFMKVSKLLAALAAVGCLLIAAFGPSAFKLFFGPEWERSGDFASILSVGVALQFVAVPLGQSLTVLRKQSIQLMWDVGRLVTVTASIAACVILHASVDSAVTSFAVSSAVAYVFLWLFSYRAVLKATKSTR